MESKNTANNKKNKSNTMRAFHFLMTCCLAASVYQPAEALPYRAEFMDQAEAASGTLGFVKLRDFFDISHNNRCNNHLCNSVPVFNGIFIVG